jgi:hypothetical protein
MHQLIRMLVPGTTEEDALAHARGALEALVGIGMDNTPVFDYYKTFEEADARFKPYVANVISDDDPQPVDEDSLLPAFPIDSEEGQAPLNDARNNQAEEFKETFSEFKAKLNDLTVEDVMNGVDAARFNLQQLAEYEELSVSLYNEFGGGLSTPRAADSYVDRLQDTTVASDGGDVGTAAAMEADHSHLGWLDPGDVHY